MRSPRDFANQILSGETEWSSVPTHLWDETHKHFSRLALGQTKPSYKPKEKEGEITIDAHPHDVSFFSSFGHLRD